MEEHPLWRGSWFVVIIQGNYSNSGDQISGKANLFHVAKDGEHRVVCWETHCSGIIAGGIWTVEIRWVLGKAGALVLSLRKKCLLVYMHMSRDDREQQTQLVG